MSFTVYVFLMLSYLYALIIHPIDYDLIAPGKFEHLQNSFTGSNTNIGDIGLAFYLGLWAYDGW